LSPDPRLAELQHYVKDITIGDGGPFPQLEAILQDDTIWGVDLVAIGMAPLVRSYFTSLIAGKGAIRNTLREYVW